MGNPLPQLPPVVLPNALPNNLPQPRFHLGDLVYWRSVPNPDFGRVLGVMYAHEGAHEVTGLHYLILLDPESPSRSICLHDFAYEEDLEPLEHPLQQHEVDTHD
jgi:hypothetical protein